MPKILLVDDEPRNLRILEGILLPLAYDLRQAASGEEALAAVAEEAPDLILLDVMMPGLSGFDVCRRLKEDTAMHFIPVVLVTALTEQESKISGLESGADDFINKPVSPPELRARVQSLLRIKQLHDQLQQKNADLEAANAQIQQAQRIERALMRELQEELDTARALQISLMPTESPRIPGLDIAGRCETVNHVGGDFFQYFERDDRLSFCLADVTGHAMKAAVPVMMFSGILESEIKHDYELGDLYASLNQTLHRKLDSRTFVCFAMGELDLTNRRMRLANSGCPYPYHYHASTSDVTELQVDAYPLGVRAETTYSAIETNLETGDYIVFCSDGIIEANNDQEEMFGFGRTETTIQTACSEGLSSGALIDRLIDVVRGFSGDEPQGDDMTCVVLRVEE